MTVEPKDEKKKGLFNIPEGIIGVIIGGVFKTLISRVAEMNFLDLTNLVSVNKFRDQSIREDSSVIHLTREFTCN